jgi:hypothetical protein
MAGVQDVGLGYCTGRGPASDLGPRNRVPVGAANESAAPASADAVSAFCHVKPSKARRALACTCAERGAQPGRRCARRTSRPAKRHSWVSRSPATGSYKGEPSGPDHRRCHPDRCADAHPCRVPRRHHPGDERGGREPVERQLGAGMNASAASQLGWYARRVARMPPAEVAWRARDRVLRAAWSRRQVMRRSMRIGPLITFTLGGRRTCSCPVCTGRAALSWASV